MRPEEEDLSLGSKSSSSDDLLWPKEGVRLRLPPPPAPRCHSTSSHHRRRAEHPKGGNLPTVADAPSDAPRSGALAHDRKGLSRSNPSQPEKLPLIPPYSRSSDKILLCRSTPMNGTFCCSVVRTSHSRISADGGRVPTRHRYSVPVSVPAMWSSDKYAMTHNGERHGEWISAAAV
jgi:hypothetical protein